MHSLMKRIHKDLKQEIERIQNIFEENGHELNFVQTSKIIANMLREQERQLKENRDLITEYFT